MRSVQYLIVICVRSQTASRVLDGVGGNISWEYVGRMLSLEDCSSLFSSSLSINVDGVVIDLLWFSGWYVGEGGCFVMFVVWNMGRCGGGGVMGGGGGSGCDSGVCGCGVSGGRRCIVRGV
jgi:hypothetical protein